MWLAVNVLSAGNSGCGLDLTVRDLSDWYWSRCRGCGLDLTVRDLGDWCWSKCRGWGLDLSVGDLSNTASRLGLAVGDLADRCVYSRAGDLAIRNLRLDTSGSGSGGGGCRSSSGCGSSSTNHDNVDWRALRGVVVIVEVVEVAAEALVPGGVIAEGELTILADGEASGVDSTSLGWVIKLELVVGGDVASPTLGIF